MNGVGLDAKNTLTAPLIGGAAGIRSKKGTFILQRQGSHNVDHNKKDEKSGKAAGANEKPSNFFKQNSLNLVEQHGNSPQANQSPAEPKSNAEGKQESSQTITSKADNDKKSNSAIRNSKENVEIQPRKSSVRTPHMRRLTNQFYIVRKEFDPFKSPPDLQLAENHRKARLVGEATEEQKLDQDNYCPCCYSIIEKKPISISCDEKELAFLGVGYAQVFLLNKFFGLLVCIIFVIGGSLLLLVQNQLNCEDKCLKILGISIMANKDTDLQLMHPMVQYLVALFIIAAILYVKKRIQKRVTKFNEGYVSPCEYSIMVQNLPLDVRKEELKRHFEKLMNRPIVMVNMAYDTEKFNHAIESKSEDIYTFNKTKYQIKCIKQQMDQPGVSDAKKESLQQKIKQLEDKNTFLASEMKINDEFIERFEKDCDNDRDPSKFLGTAFITFNDTVPVNSIIEEWGYTYLNILKFILFRWVTPPFIEYKNKLLVIRKAPAPADIIWENLRYSLPRNIVNNTLMLVLSCLILYISFKIQFWVMQYVYPLKKESYEEHSFVLMIRGSLLSICVVIVNLTLRNTVFFFTKTQKFDHHTKLLNAYVNKYIFLYFFNSAFMPYLVHGQLDRGNINIELLVWDIHFIIIATSISTPLSKLFDPVMFYKIFKRWHIQSFAPEDCPYTQKEANMWYEGHPIEIADSYAYMARVLFLGTWYAQVAPLGILFSMIGLVGNHYIDKYSLLRIHATPELITEEVYSKVIFALDLLPFIYLCGGIEYHQKNIETTNVFSIVFSFMNEGGAIVGLFLSLVTIIFHYRRKASVKAAKKEHRVYNDVKTLFHTEYDRCNPVTAAQASVEYIKFLYNQKAVYLSDNMQEMIGVTKTKNKKRKKTKKCMVDGTNVNHLFKSGSQSYQDKFLLSHSQSKAKLKKQIHQESSSESSSESDSSDSQNESDGEEPITTQVNQVNGVDKINLVHSQEYNHSSGNQEDQSTKARYGTVILNRQSIPTVSSSFQNLIHGHSAFHVEHFQNTDNKRSSISENCLPLQEQNIPKVDSYQIDDEELVKRILQKQEEIHSLKEIEASKNQANQEGNNQEH